MPKVKANHLTMNYDQQGSGNPLGIRGSEVVVFEECSQTPTYESRGVQPEDAGVLEAARGLIRACLSPTFARDGAPMTDIRGPTAADEAELRRLADELLITTDLKDWSTARALFIDGPIEVDMSSPTGGGPVQLTADGSSPGSEQASIRARSATTWLLITESRCRPTGQRSGRTATHGTGCRRCLPAQTAGRRGATTGSPVGGSVGSGGWTGSATTPS